MLTLDTPHRATNLDELFVIAARFETEESRRQGLAFQPRASDIFISPFPKCGTTWIQQIIHGLRTRGDMSFGEITEAVPWLEMAYDLGLDLDAPQPLPRAFKTHSSWHEIPKGARYIVPIRNPKDVLLSAYHFLEGWWFEAGTISVSVFAQNLFIEPRGYWQHLASWWEHKDDDNVLLLCYEEMPADPSRAIRTISAFAGIELDDELLNIVVRQSSLDFMFAHQHQFDDHLVINARNAAMGLPPGGQASKVNDVSRRRVQQGVPPEIVEGLDQIWQEEIQAKFGVPSYQALRATIREAHSKAHTG